MEGSGNGGSDAIEIDLQGLFRLLLLKVRAICFFTAFTGAAAFAASAFLIAPEYESTTSIYIILDKGTDSMLTYSDTQLAAQLAKDYEKLITSRHVVEQVIGFFGMEEGYGSFVKRMAVTNEPDTRIINITISDQDPALARDLADKIRDMAAEHIRSVTDVEAVNVVDEASLPLEPAEPSVPLWTAAGALAGFLFSVGMVVVRFLLDDTIKSAEDVERYLGMGTLALVPDSRPADKEKSRKKRAERKDGRTDKILRAALWNWQEPEKSQAQGSEEAIPETQPAGILRHEGTGESHAGH
ncbi:MAG: protein-tyrosine kinase [Clostridium sp.]|jgi:capsular polysaccharide biosynthesis protein|nr:protein-tyrosine kinase [Clostridium sp.]